MLIERKPAAIKSFSFRADLEAYEAIHQLSESLNSSPSALLRLAISDLIIKQKRVKARSMDELISNAP